MEKHYIRDGRSPIPEKENISELMSQIRNGDTKPEIAVRKSLFKSGLKGYRIHVKTLPGKPDIVFPKYKVAIFINGCFWHRCPRCSPPLPKTHTNFWANKFEQNIKRDQQKSLELSEMGWKVITLWECEINNCMDLCIELIKNTIDAST